MLWVRYLYKKLHNIWYKNIKYWYDIKVKMETSKKYQILNHDQPCTVRAHISDSVYGSKFVEIFFCEVYWDTRWFYTLSFFSVKKQQKSYFNLTLIKKLLCALLIHTYLLIHVIYCKLSHPTYHESLKKASFIPIFVLKMQVNTYIMYTYSVYNLYVYIYIIYIYIYSMYVAREIWN